jgi:hypothetical protein
MAELKDNQYGDWSKISDVLFYQITKCMDITSAVWLAACSKELCRPVAGLHHWGGPCLLVPDPSRSHYDDNTARDMVYDIVPLDYPRLTAIMSFMYKGYWVSMNDDWIAVIDSYKNWFLANAYTLQEIDIPVPGTSISKQGDLRLWFIPPIEDQMPNMRCIQEEEEDVFFFFCSFFFSFLCTSPWVLLYLCRLAGAHWWPRILNLKLGY